MPVQPQAFLSYTRIDDEFFGGAITAFRKSLELGVRVVTGDSTFRIFQDIDGIELGERWQDRLDQAVSSASFLIPIITPLFMQSAPCRDELNKFLAHEKKLQRKDLVLPIYYVTTPLFERDELLRADPVAKEIAARQRYDWREQADLEITAPQIRKSIRLLAEKIGSAITRTSATIINDPDQEARRRKAFAEVGERVAREGNSSKQATSKLILWVDDRPDNNIMERGAFSRYGIQFELARSTNEALEKIAEKHFDAIISDMGRPPDHTAGYTLLEAIRSSRNDVPFFIYAGSRAPEHIEEAYRRGAQGTTNIGSELIQMVLMKLKEQSMP